MKTLNHFFLLSTFILIAGNVLAQPTRSEVIRPESEVIRIEDREIAPSDILWIEVFGEEDMTVERQVQASGTINYWLLGTVKVNGKTPAEVAEELQKALGEDYLVNPEVTVQIKEYALRTVNVTGAVKSPNKYELPGEVRWTIVDAISAAGGFTEVAKKNAIEFTRNGKTQTVSFDKLRQEKEPAKKIWLEAGDLIHVRESWF